jgi:hypothetical protein
MGDALLELDRDRVRDEAAVELGILDLHDVDVRLARRHRFNIFPESLDVGSFLADSQWLAANMSSFTEIKLDL